MHLIRLKLSFILDLKIRNSKYIIQKLKFCSKRENLQKIYFRKENLRMLGKEFSIFKNVFWISEFGNVFHKK